MKSELPIRLVLIDPPANIDYGIQRGRGSKYQAVFVQQRTNGDVVFDFSITVSDSGKGSAPNFGGDFVQGHRRRRKLRSIKCDSTIVTMSPELPASTKSSLR